MNNIKTFKHALGAGIIAFLALLLPLQASGQNLQKTFPESVYIKVDNPLDLPREQAMVYISLEKLKNHAREFNENAFVVLDQGQEVHCQLNRNDHSLPGIVLVLENMAASESRELELRFSKKGTSKRTYEKRTQAELSHKTGGKFENRKYKGGAFKNVDYLRVPDEHTDHSYYIKYEGPGWESDKVGYRFYLDWRNAVDVFGKKEPAVVLQQIGQDGFDSYHEMQPWGMDVLKVGKALGVGSLAHYFNGKANRVDKTDSVTCRIVENGNLYSSILTNYYGWKVASHQLNVSSHLSIHAGSRLTKHMVELEGNPENISTGIGKDKNARFFFRPANDNGWTYIATYGAQSLNNDNLGLAVIFRNEDLIEITDDPFSYVVQLKPVNGKVEYYFLAAWELEKDGIKNEKQFVDYLDQTIKELNQPLIVNIAGARSAKK